MPRRIRTVERDSSGDGWIARNPWTGEEVWEGFLWRTRDVARAVVEEARIFKRPAGSEIEPPAMRWKAKKRE